MCIGYKILQRRSGVKIEVKETQGAVHDWVINKRQKEGEEVVEKAYQELINEI